MAWATRCGAPGIGMREPHFVPAELERVLQLAQIVHGAHGRALRTRRATPSRWPWRAPPRAPSATREPWSRARPAATAAPLDPRKAHAPQEPEADALVAVLRRFTSAQRSRSSICSSMAFSGAKSDGMRERATSVVGRPDAGVRVRAHRLRGRQRRRRQRAHESGIAGCSPWSRTAIVPAVPSGRAGRRFEPRRSRMRSEVADFSRSELSGSLARRGVLG